MGVSLNELEKATHALVESLNLYSNTKNSSTPEALAFRDACIQRFEFVVELSWKVSMKVLGSNTRAAKPAIREMAQNGLIEDPHPWFEFVEARNESSHTYDEATARKVFESVQKLPTHANALLIELKKI